MTTNKSNRVFMMEIYSKNGQETYGFYDLGAKEESKIDGKFYPKMKDVVKKTINVDLRDEPSFGGCIYREFVEVPGDYTINEKYLYEKGHDSVVVEFPNTETPSKWNSNTNCRMNITWNGTIHNLQKKIIELRCQEIKDNTSLNTIKSFFNIGQIFWKDSRKVKVGTKYMTIKEFMNL